jgi:hypothetical protein
MTEIHYAILSIDVLLLILLAVTIYDNLSGGPHAPA